MAGYAATFILGIYGGLFSGGYVTILTAIFVAMFRMSFLEAIGTTKLINIFSSGIATLIFMRRGIVDYRLGLILGATIFVGALLGGRFGRRLGNLWLRRIYLAAVWLLGLKTLIDVFDTGTGTPDRPFHAMVGFLRRHISGACLGQPRGGPVCAHARQWFNSLENELLAEIPFPF
jgi:uncharacterized membrane protein YfcA